MTERGRAASGAPATKTLRWFGVGAGVILGGVSALLFWKEHTTLAIVFASVAGLFALLGAAAPSVLAPVFKGWMAFARVLGWINTRVLLGVLFFVVITPIGLVFRIIRRDVLKRRLARNARTYWTPIEDIPTKKEEYEREY